MTIKLWKELGRELVFKKYSRKVERVDFELPNGTKADFYIKAEGPVVSVLALTADQKVILVQQYRPGPKAILNELPGGFVDEGEDPLDAAKREFREETGYEGEFAFVGKCLDDAYSTMERHCFVATNCRRVGAPQHTATEQTEVILCSIEELRRQLREGRMTDVEVAYLGLDRLGLL